MGAAGEQMVMPTDLNNEDRKQEEDQEILDRSGLHRVQR